MSKNEVQNDHTPAQDNRDYKSVTLLVLGLIILAWRGVSFFLYNHSLTNSTHHRTTFSNLYLSRPDTLIVCNSNNDKDLVSINKIQHADIPIYLQPLFFLPFSINLANKNLLESIPGIGPYLSGNIIAHREKNGAFTDFQELLAIPGIGEKKLAVLRKYTII